MGYDARAREATERAMIERTLGPIRKFGVHLEGCEKCGVTGWKLAFCPGQQPLSFDPKERTCPLEGQHLHLCCTACGWIITTECKDAATDRELADRKWTGAPKFRKRPVVVEALQLNVHNTNDMMIWCGGTLPADLAALGVNAAFLLETPEGPVKAIFGDWIVRGIAGEFYPVKDEIFQATYEAV